MLEQFDDLLVKILLLAAIISFVSLILYFLESDYFLLRLECMTKNVYIISLNLNAYLLKPVELANIICLFSRLT